MPKKPTRKDERFEMRISVELKERATKAAQAEGRTLAAFIIQLLERTLPKT